MKKVSLILLISVLLLGSLSAQETPGCVEPPFWWAGMKKQGLQLMVYGKKISETHVMLSYPGITLESVTQVENPDYLFIDLILSKDVVPGKFEILFNKDGKTVRKYMYEIKQREPESTARIGFNASDVIYLITPDRFANGNPLNDAVAGLSEQPNRNNPNGRHGGDLRGIINNLDYIDRLGFTAVWLNPVLENNMKEYSYHGYSTTDFYKVDPRFGSNQEYLELSKELKKRGMKLIMDMIFNHCGSEHWWMENLPMKDWINNFPEYKITTHRRTVNQDPHASEADRSAMFDGWFVPTMPDLNQRNPFLENYLIQNSIWWIEYAGLSGIRQDTWPYSDKYMMMRWAERVLQEYQNFNIVGEEWSLNPAIVSYWQRGKINQDGFKSSLPSLMDFPLQAAVSETLREPEVGVGTGFIRIYEALANDFLFPDPGSLTIFADNHDMNRIFTQLNEKKDLLKMALTFFLTTRGIPQLYYGTEILMSSPGPRKEDGIIRSDFPGGWPGDKVNGFTGEGLNSDQKEIQEYLRELLNWRKKTPVVQFGKLKHFVPENGIYVYFRYDTENTVMIILSKNLQVADLDTRRFSEVTAGFSKGFNVLKKNNLDNLENIKVDPLTAIIIELKK
jgi:glycosidase